MRPVLILMVALVLPCSAQADRSRSSGGDRYTYTSPTPTAKVDPRPWSDRHEPLYHQFDGGSNYDRNHNRRDGWGNRR